MPASYAPVDQRIDQEPSKLQAVGSNPTGRIHLNLLADQYQQDPRRCKYLRWFC